MQNQRLLSVFTLTWRSAIVILGAVGLVIAFAPFSDPNWGMFRFFTNLSNAAAVLSFLMLITTQLQHKTPFSERAYILRNTATMGLLVTMLVACFLLGNFTMEGTASISLFLLHKVVPLMALADWLMFDPKGRIKAWEPLAWLAWPILYCIFIMVSTGIEDAIGNLVSYPYPFIDVGQLGAAHVMLNIVALCTVFALLGYVWFGADRLLATVHRHQRGARGRTPAT
jgi:hypothetical protein